MQINIEKNDGRVRLGSLKPGDIFTYHSDLAYMVGAPSRALQGKSGWAIAFSLNDYFDASEWHAEDMVVYRGRLKVEV